MKNRSEKVTGRGQILTILKTNSCSIGQKSGEIWTSQTLLQPISFKSARLLGEPWCKKITIYICMSEAIDGRTLRLSKLKDHAGMGQ